MVQPVAVAPESHPRPAQPLAPVPHAAKPSVAPENSVATAHPVEIVTRGVPKRTSAALVQSVAVSGRSRAEVVLEPAELGRVRFDISTHGDRVQVTLSVERPETLDLMRRHAEELRQEFRAAGFDTGTLNFSQWGQRGEDRAAPNPFAAGEFSDDAAPLHPATDSPEPGRILAGTGLDLRL